MRYATKHLRNRSILTRRILLVVSLTFILFLAGCVTVDVINLSELNARVLISLPDAPGGYTRAIRAGDSTSTFSNYGGRVTITTLPDQDYRSLLESLREQISTRLFQEGSTLTAEEVGILVQRLQDIDDAVTSLANDDTACTVNAPEFSSVTAFLSWDSENSKWNLSCSVASDER